MAKTFFTLFDKLLDLINQAIYVIVGLAVVGFLWGVVKILFNADNEIAKKEGRNFMMYGILTLFVMTSFWGLVNLLNGTVSLNTSVNTNTNAGADGNFIDSLGNFDSNY